MHGVPPNSPRPAPGERGATPPQPPGTPPGWLPFPLYPGPLHVALNESRATPKRELTKRYTWKTRLDLELALVTYIGWYNARRRHRSLKIVENGRIRRQTPPQVLERYNQEVAMLAVAST